MIPRGAKARLGQHPHLLQSFRGTWQVCQAGSGCDPCAAAGQAVTVVRVPESWEYVLVRPGEWSGERVSGVCASSCFSLGKICGVHVDESAGS